MSATPYSAESELPGDFKEATQRHLRALIDAADAALAAIDTAATMAVEFPTARGFEYAGKMAADVVVGVAAARGARLRGATAADYLPPDSEHADELRRLRAYDAVGRVPPDVAAASGGWYSLRVVHAAQRLAAINCLGRGARCMAAWDRLPLEYLDEMAGLATTIITTVAFLRASRAAEAARAARAAEAAGDS